VNIGKIEKSCVLKEKKEERKGKKEKEKIWA